MYNVQYKFMDASIGHLVGVLLFVGAA